MLENETNWRESLPEVSFVEDRTVQQLMEEMVADYQAEYSRQTGESCVLAPADPERVKLYATAQQLFQLQQYIDRAGKLNLLKYAYGPYLDNIAALKKVVRKPASYASTVLRFTVSALREEATAIPGGTRVTAADGRYFAVREYAEIPPREWSVDVAADCVEVGAAGNGYGPGTLIDIVDPLPYIAKVENTETSSGGADTESDDSLSYRAYLAPASYSVAGPADAYRYHVMTCRSDIGDVVVSSPQPGHASILVLMADGNAPSESVLQEISDYLSGDTLRPLTDLVTVAAPVDLEYQINITYYIARSAASRAAAIQADVSAAIAAFTAWQRHIGLDINPSELIRRVMVAGAKRVELNSPSFTITAGDQVPQCIGITCRYGGLEDD